jgi:hypothetical protein
MASTLSNLYCKLLKLRSLVTSMVCVGFGWICWFSGWLLHHHWPPKKSLATIRTHDHALHHNWPKKSKILTDDHALLHHHWPKNQRFELTTMHYTTFDPQKSKIRTHGHALHHHWPPWVRDSTAWPCTTFSTKGTCISYCDNLWFSNLKYSKKKTSRDGHLTIRCIRPRAHHLAGKILT